MAYIKVDCSFIFRTGHSSASGNYEEYILQLSDEKLKAIYKKYEMDFELFGYNLSNWRN